LRSSTTLLVSVLECRYEQDPSAESLTRTLTRTSDLPGAICPIVPTAYEPRQHGALPHGIAQRFTSQDLRYHWRSHRRNDYRTLAASPHRCGLGPALAG